MVLDGLAVADDPATWRGLGFAVGDDVVRVGGIGVRLAGRTAGEGVLGWHVSGLGATELPRCPPVGPGADEHPNGVTAIDHVVAVTPDLDATRASLESAGLVPRRTREAGGGRRQVFYVLGTALLELVGPVGEQAGARFWGITLVAGDLDALAARLGDRLGEITDAVQPGRRIATLRRTAGASVPLAFITPRAESG